MNPFQINKDRSIDHDKIFLVDRLFHPIENGEIYPIFDLQITANLNSNWECQFTVYRETDGIPCPLWEQITDLALVKIENKGIFELDAPVTDETSTYKKCSGKSICEAETSQITMTLEINTENDITRESDSDPTAAYYKEFPTVFYRNIDDLTVFPDTPKFNQLNKSEKTEILRRSSLLHRVFSEMPEYAENISEDLIDDSLKNTKNIFSWTGSSVYDICQDIAQEVQCIFIFDKFSRSFAVRDLKEHCEVDQCRDIQDGVCPICQKNGTTPKIISFGKFSGVEIDTHNLAETITLSGDKDSVKNYFKIEGGDDIITNRISNRLIGNGSIWKTGSLQRSQMSAELIAALEEREQMMTADYEAGSPYQNIQDEYNKLWDQWNTLNNQILEYQSGMMPSPETADQKAVDIFEYLFGIDGKIDYAYASNYFQKANQIADSVMNYAKLLISTGHTIEYTNLTFQTETWEGHKDVVTSITFQPHIYLDGHYLEEQAPTDTQEFTNEKKQKRYADEYPASEDTPISITLRVAQGYHVTTNDANGHTVYTTDYYDYLNRILDTAMAKSDITDEILTMSPVTPSNIDPKTTSYTNSNTHETYSLPSTHYSKYCYNRLDSFCQAYASCTVILAKENGNIAANTSTVDILQYIKPDGSTSCIQDDLLKKYQNYINLLSTRMKWLDEQIIQWKNDQAKLQERIQEIKTICDMEHCLTQYANDNDIDRNLWHELCSFRRQGTYKNDNIIGEGVDESTLMQNIESLLKRAEEEIDSACNITYSASATISNLLVMPEFEPFWDQFSLGNYIHMIIDDHVHTMRLTSITYDYSDLSHCSVEFSDIIRKTKNKTEEIADILSRTSSLASSAKTLVRQAEHGEEAKLTVDEIRNDALNLANSRIITADDQDFVIDKYGITGKYTDPVSGEVSDEQIRIINNLLCFTDDNWQHTKTALGRITYQNPETNQYETQYGVIADTIVGNLLLGEKLIIRDKNGYVQIDGNGIMLDGGAIQWKNKIASENILGLDQSMSQVSQAISTNKKTILEFKTAVSQALGTTTITSNSVISPKIGGGYLYIDNQNYSVEIDPNHSAGNNTLDNYLFCIRKKPTERILSVDTQGNAYFKGTVTTAPGSKIGSLTVDDDKLIYQTFGIATPSNTTNTTALWIGNTDPSSAPFRVNHDGTFYASNAEIIGKINVASGSFTGNILLNGGCLTTNKNRTTYDEKIAGLTMDQNGIGGYYSNRQYFSLSKTGKFTATGATITGNINATAGYIGNSTDGWTIASNAIYNGCSNINSTESGTYIGTDGILNKANAFQYTMISNSEIINCGKISNTTITSGMINISSILGETGITIKNGLDNPNLNINQYTATIRNNYLDFSISNLKRSAMGYIHDNEETGFYLIGSNNIISGSFHMQNNSNLSQIICDSITTSSGTINSSDRRLKTEISDIDEREIKFILGLHPKKFKFTEGTSGRFHYGLIAQDVDDWMKKTIGDAGLLVKQEQHGLSVDSHVPIDFQDDTTYYYGLRYEEFISPMVKTIQQLNKEIQELKKQICTISHNT